MKQIGYVVSSYWEGPIRVCVVVRDNLEEQEAAAKRQAVAIANKPRDKGGKGCDIPFPAILDFGRAEVEWGETFTPRVKKTSPQLQMKMGARTQKPST